jgi:hypothetical protein
MLTTYTVNSTADSDTGSANSGTLRYVINQLNSVGQSSNTISFDLGPAGQQETIALTSPLPNIINPVDIEGGTEPGFDGAPLVVISGASAGSGAGLTLASGSSGSAIQDLVIDGFAGAGVGIAFPAGIAIASPNDGVTGCYIGTNVPGSAAAGNLAGIIVDGGGTGATIGGSVTGDANTIAGNGSYGIFIEAASCLVVGDLIGTDSAGSAIPNADGIVVNSYGTGATIGGSVTGDANTISGNTFDGIDIDAASCLVVGDWIGTDAAGFTIGNYDGIYGDFSLISTGFSR